MPPKASANDQPDRCAARARSFDSARSIDAFIALAVACGEDWNQLQANLLPYVWSIKRTG